MANTTPVSVRVSDHERLLLEAAAANAQTNLSDFMRRKAVEAAELTVLDQRRIVIAAEDWSRFEAWAGAPPAANEALRRLAATRPAWQD